jgi:AhpD family alkylhydroperoxidase
LRTTGEGEYDPRSTTKGNRMSLIHSARMEAQDYYQVAPDVTRALRELGAAVEASGLDKGMLELMKLRASQINGCTYCLQYHLNVARMLGVSQHKLDLAGVWREAGIFTERECAALALTEALTARLADGLPDDLWEEVRAVFTESETAFLAAAVANINAWNRIAIAMRFTPPAPRVE